MSRTNQKNKIDKDKYITPHWCVDILVNHLNKERTHYGNIVDLGAGDFRIGRKIAYESPHIMHDMLIGVDVDSAPKNKKERERWIKRDYTKVDPMKFGNKEAPTLFVSNPPYSLCGSARGNIRVGNNNFVMRTVEAVAEMHYNSKAAFLLSLSWLGSKARAEFNKKFPPTEIIVLVPRPSFAKNGSDSNEYGWFIWHKMHMNNAPGLTNILVGNKNDL